MMTSLTSTNPFAINYPYTRRSLSCRLTLGLGDLSLRERLRTRLLLAVPPVHIHNADHCSDKKQNACHNSSRYTVHPHSPPFKGSPLG